MLHGLAVLLIFQLFGESLVFLLGLPLPGPVLGLVLLIATLPIIQHFRPQDVLNAEQAAQTLLANLGLLFVPAGVGVVALGTLLGSHAGAIAIVLCLSAIVTLAVTVWVFVLVHRRLQAKRSS